METININGKEYVEKAEDYRPSEHVCVIADRGWIFEGMSDPENPCRLTNAHVVRKWSNGLGIGGIAKAAHKDDYTLDEIGCIEVSSRAVIAVIPIEEW